MAVFESALEPDVKKKGVVGEVDISFNCKPQLFLKTGEVEVKIENGGIIYNPTPYTANPTIRFAFSNSSEGGSITINGRTISIQNPGTVKDFIIDCERQDIYLKETRANRNSAFILSDGEFFEIKPGRNRILCSGLTYDAVYVTPNWWTV